MKVIITENQYKKLVSTLSEAEIPQNVQFNPAGLGAVQNLASLYFNPVETILSKLNPDAIQKLMQRLGVDDVNDIKSSDLQKSGIMPNLSTGIDFANPLGDPKYRITSQFNEPRAGRRHKGIDIAAPINTPIYSPANGTITGLKMYGGGGCGKFLQIDHGNVITKYCHLNGWANGIKIGSTVKKGQHIGFVGNSGKATGAHLHYELINKSNSLAMNPQQTQFGIA